MITILNDYLLDIIIGVVNDYYCFDAQSIEDQIDESLLDRLIQEWPNRSQIGKKAIKIHLGTKVG